MQLPTPPPPLSSIPWGWRGLLELLQTANQLRLLVRGHAGEHSGSDEDLQGREGSVFVSQHPASLHAQEDPGYSELCQLGGAEGIFHQQKTPQTLRVFCFGAARLQDEASARSTLLGDAPPPDSPSAAGRRSARTPRQRICRSVRSGRAAAGGSSRLAGADPAKENNSCFCSGASICTQIPAEPLEQWPEPASSTHMEQEVKRLPLNLNFRHANDGILDKKPV